MGIVKRVYCIDGPVNGDQYWDPDNGQILFIEGHHTYRLVDEVTPESQTSRPNVTYVAPDMSARRGETSAQKQIWGW